MCDFTKESTSAIYTLTNFSHASISVLEQINCTYESIDQSAYDTRPYRNIGCFGRQSYLYTHFDQPPLRELVIWPTTVLQLLKRRITIPCEPRLVANQMTSSQMHTLFVPVH